MPAGVAPGVVSALLNYFNGTAPTPPAALWAQLHVGDPGVAGTANLSALTTRQTVLMTASSSGSPIALSNTPSFTMTTTETIAFVSFWSASSGGTFEFSAVFNVAQGVNSGDIVLLATLTMSMLAQAA
jgi:hypothetical protein